MGTDNNRVGNPRGVHLLHTGSVQERGLVPLLLAVSLRILTARLLGTQGAFRVKHNPHVSPANGAH